MPEFLVPPSAQPQTAKDFLRKNAGISLTLWRKIKACDAFFINGCKAVPALAHVNPNDKIAYEIETSASIQPETMPLAIAYEDDEILILDKPAGQLVHPTAKERRGTLANGVLAYYQKRNLSHGFHPVHRLDKDTSGLVLIAKMPHIQHLFSGLQKNFARTYLALIPGKMPEAQGTINLPIKRLPGSIILRAAAPDGQRAVTHYKTKQSGENLSLLELRLETGRTHQIRVHLAAAGHPLLGDDLYGGSLSLIQRQALHAARLSFIHPVTNKSICICSRLPADMRHIVRTLPKI